MKIKKWEELDWLHCLSMYLNLCWHSWLHSTLGKSPTGFMFDIQSPVGTSHVFWQRLFLPRQDFYFSRGTYMLSWCDKCFNFPTMNLDKSVYLFFFLFVNNLFYHISHRSLNFQSYFQHNAISNYQTKSLYSAISQTLLWSNISP